MSHDPREDIRPVLRRILRLGLAGLSLSTASFAALGSLSGSLKSAAGALLCGVLLWQLRVSGVARVGQGMALGLGLLVLDSVLRFGPNAMLLPSLLLLPVFALFTRSRQASLLWGAVAVGVLGVMMLVPAQPLASDTVHRVSLLFNYGIVLALLTVLMLAYDGALRRQQAQLLAAEQVKNSFLATMSHELRTPLNGVLGSCEVLEADSLSAPQRALLGEIQRSGQALLGLVDDLLMLSQLEGARLPVQPEPTLLDTTLADLLEHAHSEAQVRGLRLHVVRDARLPPRLHLDPVGTRYVLRHLLSNALKFTPSGEITLCLGYTDGTLRLSVQDTGVGIAPEALARLFEPFTQAEMGARRSHDGAGIGLALSLRLVEAMGGTLSADSQPGVGSTFSLRIPAPQAATALPPPAPTDARRGTLRVLVAEDNRVNQQVIRAMLSALGCEVTTAIDGEEADRFAETADVILMDCHMPRLDGIEATRRIRSRGITIPILALTADTLQETRTLCLDAGMDAVLYKPIQKTALQTALQAYAERAPAARSA